MLIVKQDRAKAHRNYVILHNSMLQAYSDEITALGCQISRMQIYLRHISASMALLEHQWKEGNEYHRRKWMSFVDGPLMNEGKDLHAKMITTVCID
jgi:hypothetical protein